jgi:hypothetical protein
VRTFNYNFIPEDHIKMRSNSEPKMFKKYFFSVDLKKNALEGRGGRQEKIGP